jgi:pyruvate/2-oxoglutarate dehydrogenase complex dihydrolipoamide acyltransferase (E2) component
MTHDVVMPQMGLTMTEGTLASWLKKVGDPVEEGEPICVVDTDKATTELEAPVSGLITEILIQADTVVPVGTVLARLTDNSA